MTDSNILRAKIIEAMLDAFCKEAFRHTGPSEETMHHVRAGITAAFYAQHGLACVTDKDIFKKYLAAAAMLVANDLTRKPE